MIPRISDIVAYRT